MNYPAESISTHNVAEAEAILRRANDAYHRGAPVMTDPEYDALRRRHQEARDHRPADPFWASSILNQVGGTPESGFRVVRHPFPLLSLTNAFELKSEDPEAELRAWIRKCATTYQVDVWSVEPKIDGLSLGIIYSDGKLISAALRGNGVEGEDVTVNVLAANLLPETVPYKGYLFLRGEVFIYWSDFLQMNAAAKAAGLDEMANPRNAASGAIRLHDPTQVASRGLSLLIYDMVDGMPAAKTHKLALEALRVMGLPTVDAKIVDLSMLEETGSVFAAIPPLDDNIPMDGRVFKFNNFARRVVAGMGTTSPNWAIAYKNLPTQEETTLTGITVQVGTTGVLTPVADLIPVFVAGSTITSATLHNERYINDRFLKIGGRVIVEKAGHVIPRVAGVPFTNEPVTDFVKFDLVRHIGGKCPSCGSGDIRQLPGQVAWRCMNTDECPAQLATRILRFGSRAGLDLDQLGTEIAIAMAESGRVIQLVDVLGLDLDFIANLSWRTADGKAMSCGVSRAGRITQSILRAEQLPLHRWLYALCIPSVGENTPKELSRLYLTIHEIEKGCGPEGIIGRIAAGEKKDSEFLAPYQVSSHIGPVTAKILVKYFRSPAGMAATRVLGAVTHGGSTNYNPIPQVTAERPLTGKTFVITGTLSVDRNAIKAKIEAKGGKCSDSVSAKTDYLVAGENAGSKLAKARKHAVKVLNEAELDDLLHATD